jgi:hypothetical protein
MLLQMLFPAVSVLFLLLLLLLSREFTRRNKFLFLSHHRLSRISTSTSSYNSSSSNSSMVHSMQAL